MRLDPKHFNKFMAVLAVAALALIAYATFSYRTGQEQQFRKRVAASDSLYHAKFPLLFSEDTVRVSRYSDRIVVLDFWASWSDFSSSSHRELMRARRDFGDSITVIAAAVKDVADEVEQYRRRHDYPFVYADGTTVYNRFNVPGLPTQIIFRPGGKIARIFIGYSDSTRYDSLMKTFRNE